MKLNVLAKSLAAIIPLRKTSCPAVLGAVALVGAAAFAPSAQAAYLVNVTESGSDLLVTGSGSLNIAGLSVLFTATVTPQFDFSNGVAALGTGSDQDFYGVSYTGSLPSTQGGRVFDSGSGDPLAILLWGALGVPMGYVSGHALSSTNTLLNTSFADLSMTQGTYTLTYVGNGAVSDTITFQVGPAVAAVPEPSTAALIGVGLLGALGLRRRRT